MKRFLSDAARDIIIVIRLEISINTFDEIVSRFVSSVKASGNYNCDELLRL